MITKEHLTLTDKVRMSYLPEGWKGSPIDVVKDDLISTRDKIWILTTPGILPVHVVNFYILELVKERVLPVLKDKYYFNHLSRIAYGMSPSSDLIPLRDNSLKISPYGIATGKKKSSSSHPERHLRAAMFCACLPDRHLAARMTSYKVIEAVRLQAVQKASERRYKKDERLTAIEVAEEQGKEKAARMMTGLFGKIINQFEI